ncbi:Uncharacterised protein [Mycobacterium tuberculosis]|nr:Uncharacterised protein [Mycobacterium tuberculosis]
MDHVARRHVTGRGLDRFPKPNRRLLGGLALQLGAAGAGDGRSDTTGMPQSGVRRIGDGVELELGHVGLMYLQLDHRHIVPPASTRRPR